MIQRYSVSMPHQRIKLFYDLGKIKPMEAITNLFILMNQEAYDENMGLLLEDDEGGNAIFW